MIRLRKTLVATTVVAAAATVRVVTQVTATRPTTGAPYRQAAVKTFRADNIRSPTVHVQLAQGFHAGQPMLIAIDEIVSVSPWAMQRM